MTSEQIQALKAAAIAVGRDGRTDDEWFHYLQCVHYKFILALLAEREDDKALIAELQGIRAAAEKLVRCKGRFHSEQNYRALAALFGVSAPDLPPLDNEACTLTVDLRKHLVNEVMIISQMDRQYSEGWCSANDWAIHKVREACAAAGITLVVGGE